MDELIDILDANGHFTSKTLMKSEAHRKGLFHLSVHIWFYTENGEILLQKRAKNKDTHPNLWDVSVAGHVGAGENPIYSAIREIQEEIGLAILENELHMLGVFKYQHQHRPDLVDREFHHTFLCPLKVPLNNLSMQESEVAELALIPQDQYQKELSYNITTPKYVPYDSTYLEAIFGAISQRL